MVKAKKNKSGEEVVPVKVTLDKRVHDKLAKLAQESGLSVPKFIAEVVEGLALDPTLRLLHDDPALAREVAVKALSDYLDGGVRVTANAGAEEDAIEPEPEPEPDPNAEARELLGEIMSRLGPIAEELGVPMGGNGKGPGRKPHPRLPPGLCDQMLGHLRGQERQLPDQAAGIRNGLGAWRKLRDRRFGCHRHAGPPG